MRIPNITMSDAVVERLNTLRNKQNQINQQLATGQRISRASEDPQSASRVMSLRSEMAITQQYGKNVDLAMSISQATGSALDSLSSTVERAGVLATLAVSATASPAQKASYAVEMNQLMLQAMQAGNTEFNGQFLFNGTNTAVQPYNGTGADLNHPDDLDATKTPSASPGGDGLSIQLSDSLAVSPYNRGDYNVKITTLILTLRDARNAMEANDTAALTTARNNLKTSEADIVAAVADNASGRARLDSIKEAASQRFMDIGALIGGETDVDIAQSMVDLTKTQTAYQAALQAGAQVLRLSLLDYIR
jgi:flagellar hook-associated protein 3 FlgL